MEPIALVGLACRFPGADGPDRLWRLLLEGGDAIREVPPERWDAGALYDPDPEADGRMTTRWGGFIDGIDEFDCDFFGMAAREAAWVDPQQRLLLEVVYEALEDAGQPASTLSGRAAGVFVGASTYDHGAAQFRGEAPPSAWSGTGSALSIAANRVSYSLDLRGPSVAVDTACSSSLVAAHLACQSLRLGESEVAIVGGVNAILLPDITISFSRAGVMAPDGRCKPFDHRADGYVRSEGVGALVLKRAADALADGDRVYAVILGSALNQDGRSNGLIAPNRLAQQAVLRAAYDAAGVDPASVDYVEAHGTGTAVGDPIEVGALGTVMCDGRPADRPLRIGSVKSNLGHLEAAAGVAGLAKTALALHRGMLPPTIHFERANPMLGLDRLPIRVQAEAEPWPSTGGPPTAGVSAFGFGGTNAHAVLQAAPARARRRASAQGRGGEALPQLLPVSARGEAALLARAGDLAEAAASAGAGWLEDAVHAAACRRDQHEHRAAVVASEPSEAADALRALAAGGSDAHVAAPRRARRRAPRPVLVFPGQGSQWVGMGRRLAATVPAFREAVECCDAALARVLGYSLWDRERGFVAEGTEDVQRSLFAMQVALAETWMAWGLEPGAVVGHSLGEVAAAHACGALTLDEAALVACERSAALAGIEGAGGMLLVELGLDEAREAIRGREDALSVAASNSPRATVLSGSLDALAGTREELEAAGVFVRRVAVDFAAHSPQVEPLQPRLRDALSELDPRPERFALYSTVTAGAIDGSELDAGYWARNLRSTVLFAPAVERLLEDGHDVFVEVAPHPVLARSLHELADVRDAECAVLPSLRRDEDELRAMLGSLGELYALGGRIEWGAVHDCDRDLVSLPPNPWRRRRFPLASAAGTAAPGAGARAAEAPGVAPPGRRLLGPPLRVAAEPALSVHALDVAQRYLADHVVAGVALVPGAAWLAAAARAAESALAGSAVVLEGVGLSAPCPVASDGSPGHVQLSTRLEAADRVSFEVASAPPAGAPVRHAAGTARLAAPGEGPPVAALGLDELRARCGREIAVAEHYEALAEPGLEYGPAFRGVVELRAGEREALARVRLPSAAHGSHDDAAPHPALLDACLQALAAAAGADAAAGGLPLPVAMEQVWAPAECGLAGGWCHARVRAAGADELEGDVLVMDDAGRPRWAARGVRVRLAGRRQSPGELYEVRWEEHELDREGAAGAAWLVVGDERGAAGELARRLAGAGARCEVAAPAAVGDALRALAAGAGVDAVVHLADVDGAGDGAVEALRDPAAAVLRTAAAMAAVDWPGEPPALRVVTAGVQPAGRVSGPLAPAAAPVWGIARCVANERPELVAAAIDAGGPLDGAALDELAEVLRAPRLPAQLALRGGRVLVPRLAPLSAAAGSGARVRGDRTYLVTGGLGALGRQVARWLVERGARHIALVGRSAPSAEAERDVAAMRELGARVATIQADVADAAALDAVLADVAATGAPLAGVVHAAGVLEAALAHEVDEAMLDRALAPKAAGAWNLHRATVGLPLDFFVMFASLAGVVGSPGQGAYAAANAFLDALAWHRAERGLPATSVDWGPWADGGLAVEASGYERLATRGVPPLAAAHALELLDRALGGAPAQVVATAFDLEALAEAGAPPAARELMARLLPGAGELAPERGVAAHELLALPDGPERRRAMHAHVAGAVATVLSVAAEDVDPEMPLQDLGFDSLMAMELRDRLEVALDLRLSAALMFAHPSVASLAEALLERLDGAAAPQPAAPETAAVPEPEPADDDLATLDEDELAAVLAAQIRTMERVHAG
ncbi:MAG TPA: type I polyketide synthase [Thermoleophilaceae bacterium]|jgi:myxalamid-type polyketide synthase MxaE and MxaD